MFGIGVGRGSETLSPARADVGASTQAAHWEGGDSATVMMWPPVMGRCFGTRPCWSRTPDVGASIEPLAEVRSTQRCQGSGFLPSVLLTAMPKPILHTPVCAVSRDASGIPCYDRLCNSMVHSHGVPLSHPWCGAYWHDQCPRRSGTALTGVPTPLCAVVLL